MFDSYILQVNNYFVDLKNMTLSDEDSTQYQMLILLLAHRGGQLTLLRALLMGYLGSF